MIQDHLKFGGAMHWNRYTADVTFVFKVDGWEAQRSKSYPITHLTSDLLTSLLLFSQNNLFQMSKEKSDTEVMTM